MKKRALSMLLAATLVVTSALSLTACGTKTETNDKPSQTTKKFEGTRVYKTIIGKIKTLNPHTSIQGTESEVMSHINSSLTGFILNDKKIAEEVPLMAKELPTISEDKLTYTYKLREDLKFSNGTPIDANTFIYSFQKVLDPVMKNMRASSYMNDISIKNAENYFDGKCKWEDVGIKAVDKYTLQFTLEIAVKETQAKGVFNYDVLVEPTLYEKFMTADKKTTTYGTSQESIVSYGPYVLSEWKFDQFYKFERNKDFPLNSIYTPDVVEARVVDEQGTQLQMFEKGEIDEVSIAGARYEKYKEDPRLYPAPGSVISTMNVNTESKTNPVLANKDFRKALFYCLDREKIAKDLVKAAVPAAYIIPKIFTTEIDKKNVSIRELPEAQANVAKNNGFDPKLAKEYFDKAYAANGNKKITVTCMYADTSDIQKARSEYTKKVFEETFGADKFEFKLQATPGQVMTENIRGGKYEVGYWAWQGAYKDNAATRLKVFAEWEGKTDTFRNKEYQELVERCTKGDLIFKEKEKTAACIKMEQILLDECIIIPIFEDLNFYMFSDKLKFLNGKKYDPKVGFGTYQAEFTR